MTTKPATKKGRGRQRRSGGHGANSSSARQRASVARFRANMRKKGMRLLQIWVPDTAAPAFAEECRRQSLLVSRNSTADDRALDAEFEAWAGQVDGELGDP